MIKRNDIKVTVYEAPVKGFLIDIVNDGNEYGAWLYHEKHCKKTFLFGVDAGSTDPETFAELVEANLEDGCHYISYAFDHMDEENKMDVFIDVIQTGMVFEDADGDWEITGIDGYYVTLREIHTGEESGMVLEEAAEYIRGAY